MTVLSSEQIIKNQNYRKQGICYSLFLAVAVAVLTVEVVLTKDLTFDSVFQLGIVILVIVIPFGYFLGFRRLRKTLIAISKVKTGRFYFIKKQVTDKTKVHADSSDRFSQIVFGEDDGIWVSEKQYKEIKTGDSCYLLFLENEDSPCAVYSASQYTLAPEMVIKDA